MERGLVTESSKNFMIDVYCKFLFPFTFAIFLFTLITGLATNFSLPQNGTFMLYLTQFYHGVVLPFLAVLDLYTTPRRRNPIPTTDIVILLLICFGHCGYKILVSIINGGNINLILPIFSEYIILALVSINGYIFYDYINHRKVGGSGYYILFENDINFSKEKLVGGNNNAIV